MRVRETAIASGAVNRIPLQNYTIAYAVPARQFSPIAASGNSGTHMLEFAAAAYDADGHLLNNNVVEAAATVGGKSKYYQVVQPFDVPTSAKWICVAVRDAATGRIGNLEFALPLTPEPPAK